MNEITPVDFPDMERRQCSHCHKGFVRIRGDKSHLFCSDECWDDYMSVALGGYFEVGEVGGNRR